jgi:hypothetical protein
MDFDDFFSSASFLYQLFDAAIVYNLPETGAVHSQPTFGEDSMERSDGFVTLFYNNKIIFFSIFWIYIAKVYKEQPSCEVLA